MLELALAVLGGFYLLGLLRGHKRFYTNQLKPNFLYEGANDPEPYAGAPPITNRERLLRDTIDIGPSPGRSYSDDKAKLVAQTMRRDPEHELWPAYMNKAVYWRHHPFDQQK